MQKRLLTRNVGLVQLYIGICRSPRSGFRRALQKKQGVQGLGVVGLLGFRFGLFRVLGLAFWENAWAVTSKLVHTSTETAPAACDTVDDINPTLP